MRNGLSVDVEDWFQVGAFERTIDRADWPTLECRVEANCDAVLQMFAEAGVHGTFFTLGWVAERYPALIRRIVAAGHELASHGYDHKRVFQMSADDFAAMSELSARFFASPAAAAGIAALQAKTDPPWAR